LARLDCYGALIFVKLSNVRCAFRQPNLFGKPFVTFFSVGEHSLFPKPIECGVRGALGFPKRGIGQPAKRLCSIAVSNIRAMAPNVCSARRALPKLLAVQ
jgi:hypothetical protein